MANTLIPIQTYTLTGTTASVTFSNIPQNYTDLKFVISARTTSAADWQDVIAKLNGTTSTYTQRYFYGTNNAGAQNTVGYSAAYFGNLPGANITSGIFSNVETYIPNYTSSVTKSWMFDSVSESTSATAYLVLSGSGVWSGTSPITQIEVYPSVGSFTVGSTLTLYGISNGVKATGGTVTVSGGYAYHTFTSSGALLPNQIIRGAEVLLVAGGGGGSSANGAGAGGGAGGVVSSQTGTLNAGTSYLATVGAGGSGSAINNSGNNGVTGNNSTFASAVVALGGGGGTATTITGYYGLPGGSGGGVTPSPVEATRYGGLGTSGQGNNGGNGNGNWGGNYGAGGGGGAGGAGLNGNTTVSGSGGPGTTVYSTWLSTTGTGVSYGGTYYIAGGGAGGARTANNGGFGGIGGGANGSSTSTGLAGTANTGGGGAGAGGSDGLAAGGAGGSGLVIVRYPLN